MASPTSTFTLLRAFVVKYGVDDKAHGDTEEWQRVQF
jgi:hypothetical protein